MSQPKRLQTLFFMLYLGTASIAAQAGDAGSIHWIITGESPTLDRSSTYLAGGNIGAGIRNARKALQRSGSPLRDIIANHNLCLGLALQGDTQAADEYCARISNLQLPEITLVKVREGVYRVTSRTAGTDAGVNLASQVSANLAALDTIELAGVTD